MKIDLWAGNSPASFWQLEAPADEHEWIAAMAEALPVLCLPEIGNTADLLWMTLGEGQFGHKHFTPSMVRWLYYRFKGYLPDHLMMPLRRALGNVQRHRYGLSWPLEERHARFQWLTLQSLFARRDTQPQRYRRLWPGEARYAFVLTHDVAQRDNLRVGRHDGIVSVIEALKGHPLFAHVTLSRSERSAVAALVTDLLDGPGF